LCRGTQTGEMALFLSFPGKKSSLLIKWRVWEVLGELFAALLRKEFSLSCLRMSRLQFRVFLCELVWTPFYGGKLNLWNQISNYKWKP
jgi:hypothetical protein